MNRSREDNTLLQELSSLPSDCNPFHHTRILLPKKLHENILLSRRGDVAGKYATFRRMEKKNMHDTPWSVSLGTYMSDTEA